MTTIPPDLFQAVRALVGGDKYAAMRWFENVNPILMDQSPAELLERGCERLLRSIIYAAKFA